jgi:tetratricopeptide (TPR) repeat protein
MKKRFIIIGLIFIALTPAPAQTQEAQNKFRLAQSFEQAGEFDRASRLYEDLANADSSNFLYFDGLRRCYEQVKNYDAAIGLSLRRLTQQPSDPNALATLGSIYYKSGDEGRADSVWNAVIAFAPSSVASYRMVASVQSDNRLFDKSIATYLRGRKVMGEPALFVGELSAFYSLIMNYAEATREYITMLTLNEHQLDFVESRLSAITSKDEGLNAATKVAEEAVSRQNNSVVLHRLLLWLYMEGKRFDRAFDAAKTLEEAISANGAEMLLFADRAFKEKSYDTAAKAYRFAIEKYPSLLQLPLAKYGYARAIEELSAPSDTTSASKPAIDILPLETQPGYRGAMALFLTLAKEYPYSEISVQSLYRVGLIRYETYFDLDGALQVLDSILTLVSARRMVPSILETVAGINVAQGKLDKAAERYSAVLSSPIASPGQKTQAQFRLAEIRYFQNDFDSAVALLQHLSQMLSVDESNDALLLLHFIKENQPGFTDALKEYALAELLMRQKKISEAIAVLTSTIQAFPEAPLVDDALIQKADLSIVLKQYDTALFSYGKLLTDYPKSILREKAQFGIAQLYQNQFKDKEKAIKAYEEVLSTYPHSLFVDEARKRIRQLRGDAI